MICPTSGASRTLFSTHDERRKSQIWTVRMKNAWHFYIYLYLFSPFTAFISASSTILCLNNVFHDNRHDRTIPLKNTESCGNFLHILRYSFTVDHWYHSEFDDYDFVEDKVSCISLCKFERLSSKNLPITGRSFDLGILSERIPRITVIDIIVVRPRFT